MESRIALDGVPIDTNAPVLVTGATGYVASWIVKGLLDAGVTVHAAVRDPRKTSHVRHLLDAAETAPAPLRLFASELTSEGSYSEAMAGCRIVIHTASPFIREVADPQRDLVDPAVNGTRNVLTSVEATTSVERVVLTSSAVAMYGDSRDVLNLPGGVLDERAWNTTSSLTSEPYSYSKTLAEREAWRLVDGQQRWRLVTINPALVIGPSMNASPSSESFRIVRQMADGSMRWGAPRISVAVVDVREVAYAHIAAAFLPDADGRHLVAAESTDMVELGRRLLPRFGARVPLPKRPIPKRLAVAVAPAVGLERGYLKRNVDIPIGIDTAKSREQLGLRYRPAQQSLEDMFAQVVAAMGVAGG